MGQDYKFADPNWESYDFSHWTIPRKGVTKPDFTFEDGSEKNSIKTKKDDEKCDCGKSKHTVEIRQDILFHQMFFSSATFPS